MCAATITRTTCSDLVRELTLSKSIHRKTNICLKSTHKKRLFAA